MPRPWSEHFYIYFFCLPNHSIKTSSSSLVPLKLTGCFFPSIVFSTTGHGVWVSLCRINPRTHSALCLVMTLTKSGALFFNFAVIFAVLTAWHESHLLFKNISFPSGVETPANIKTSNNEIMRVLLFVWEQFTFIFYHTPVKKSTPT